MSVGKGFFINEAYRVQYFILKVFQEKNILPLSFFLCKRKGALQCDTIYLTCDTQGVVTMSQILHDT